MNYPYGGVCDEFHISTRLFLKMDLTLQRETVLHFFDSVKREFPGMRKLRRREDEALILEEDPGDEAERRWLRLESGAIRFGVANPLGPDSVRRFGDVVLEMAPFHLTLGELDYDHLEVVYGFDLEYRGNHDQLVADTLFPDHPIVSLLGDDKAPVIDCQPFVGVALSPECDVQAYLDIKSRTTTYEIRTGQFEPQYLSVFLTLRKYWGFHDSPSLVDAHRDLLERAEELASDRVMPAVINPLAQAIASR